jgi:hypothetical protein
LKQPVLQKIEHLQKHITRRHKSIHLALEVKTLFDNSTPAMGSSVESSTQSLDFPLMVINGIAGREERRNMLTIVKAKLKQLHLARLTRHDQAVRLLDMPRLQVVKTLKPTTTSFNHF